MLEIYVPETENNLLRQVALEQVNYSENLSLKVFFWICLALNIYQCIKLEDLYMSISFMY